MISYLDKTFCISPKCKNECGRKLTDEIRKGARGMGIPVCTAYFCGSPYEKSMEKNIKDKK